MATWAVFEEAEPEMAEAGRALIYQFGIGLGFLATVRKDGGPRLHPFCPVLAVGELWGFIIPSPKREDLLRDGRFAFHTFPPEKVDDEFYVTGTARQVTDQASWDAALASYEEKGGKAEPSELLFAFDIEQVMWAKYEGRPSWPPAYRTWRAD